MTATKHDSEKPRMDLLSSKWLIGVAKVLTFGAKKYEANNWRKGHQASQLIGAALRHITAFNDGENLDSESGLSHLYHASCCLMFLAENMEVRPEFDDRWKEIKKDLVEISDKMKNGIDSRPYQMSKNLLSGLVNNGRPEPLMPSGQYDEVEKKIRDEVNRPTVVKNHCFKLNACPCCHSTDVELLYVMPNIQYRAFCFNCGTSSRFRVHDFEAVSEWNNRA